MLHSMWQLASCKSAQTTWLYKITQVHKVVHVAYVICTSKTPDGLAWARGTHAYCVA